MAPLEPARDVGLQKHWSHRGARVASWALILLVRAYQLCIRPLLVGTCKFAPTCSEYAIEAIRRHGPWRGGWLGLRRLTRCHPFSSGGVDPVPF